MISLEEATSITAGIQKALKEGKRPAFAYDRVSDQANAGGISLEYQETHAGYYAERNGLMIVHYFTVIESARKEGRKVFNRMIDLAMQFNVKDLIFKNTDRMSRNYRDLMRIEDIYEKHGVTIHFYQTYRTLNQKSTYADKFIMNVEIAAARQLSDKLSHDVRETQKFKAARGVPPGRLPMGYSFSKEKRTIIIDPKHERFIRFMFDEYDSGKYTLQQFVDFLNDQGYRSQTGRLWNKSYIHVILTNRIYTGSFEYGGDVIKGNYEAYIDEERFEKRMEQMGALRMGTKTHSHDFLFSGILYCAECGRRMTGDRKKGRFTYYVHACRKTWKGVYIPEDDISRIIDDYVREYAITEGMAETLKSLFLDAITIKTSDQQASVSVISRQISELEVKQSRILDLFADAQIDHNALKRKMEEFQKEIDRLEKQKKQAGIDRNKFILKTSEIIETMRRFPEIYAESTGEHRVAIIKSMASKVLISQDQAEISWIPPYSFIMKKEILEGISLVRNRPETHARRDSNPWPTA